MTEVRSTLRSTVLACKGEFMAVGVFSLVTNVLMLVPALFVMHITDSVLVNRNEMTLLFLTLTAVLMFCMVSVAEWSRSRVLARVSTRLDTELAGPLFDGAFRARLAQTVPEPARALADLTLVRQFLTGHAIFAFFDLPWTLLYLGVLFALHPVLGSGCLALAVLQALLTLWNQRRERAPSALVVEAETAQRVFTSNKLQNVEVVEAMGMFPQLCFRWLQRHAAWLKARAAAARLAHVNEALNGYGRHLLHTGAVALAAWLVTRGELSAGGMLAVYMLILRALTPVESLLTSWRGLSAAKQAMGRVDALLANHRAPRTAASVEPARGRLVLQAVNAQAPGPARARILHEVTLSFEPGTVTTVLGPSGAGKSTLARVMLGIWPQVTGAVTLDDRPLETWRREDLGPALGYLPQDVELMDGTFAENIARFGLVDPAQVVAAAKAASLHEVILRFPKGYDTPVGERGSLLAGGLRQRIGLARALYGSPVLVVLDEPNANLDDVGEAALLQALQGLRRRGATVVMVTHEKRLLSVTDRVVILNQGRVHFAGSMEELVRSAADEQDGGSPPLLGDPEHQERSDQAQARSLHA
jgi:ATP-binding cassette subfamily C exporter for protease/lipase